MDDPFYATLFPDDGERTYAIIDGASCEELLGKLNELQPGHVCLYAGELEPGVDLMAPYLVELLPGHPFTDWVFTEGFGKHWGIFARSPGELRAMRKHFRRFLLVKDPEGKTIYFRYYDPRVLLEFMPTTNAEDREVIFGDISEFFCEAKDQEFIAFRRDGGLLDRRKCFTAAALA